MKWTEGEIDGVIIKPLKKFSDSRGWLLEVFRSDEIPESLMPAMGYVSLTLPGVTRGPHEHLQQTDTFAFVGPGNLRVTLWDKRVSSRSYGKKFVSVAGQDNPVVMVIPPGVVHCYKNISAHDGWVLNFPNRLYAGKGKKEKVDEIRYEDSGSGAFLEDSSD
jgi:dTDP-4-dehydrorhamnose 3,5-epimerase